MKRIHVIGGGTFSHVRNHFALAAPAFGGTARRLHHLFHCWVMANQGWSANLHLTKMADPDSKMVTNQDVADLIERLKDDPETRVIILNAALCDFDGEIDGVESGPHAPRLKSRDGARPVILTPAPKLIGSIRRERKDIVVVGFKTTTGETPDVQYAIALNALKRDSVNLVVANDTVTRHNMIVAPEETRYCETTDRNKVEHDLFRMVVSRAQNTFTRSTVVDGPPVPWNDHRVPDNLREIVNHCITRGAYKPFRGATVGHFAVKVDDRTIITSGRKRDFNRLAQEGMVLVEYEGDDRVIAHGAKPSVGGQSQRAIFRDHPDISNIVHFHSEMRPNAPDRELIGIDPDQWSRECGSHQCGQSVADKLPHFGEIRAVMIENHGPNIVFGPEIQAERVIEFIERNFDLTTKTGGLVA